MFCTQKLWGVDNNPAHVEPNPIPLIKETSIGNSDGDYVKLNLHRDPMSSTSDLYEFRKSLFDHVALEKFLLIVQNFQISLAATGMLEMEAKIQYLCTLLCGEALCQFDLVSADAKNIKTLLDVDYLLKGLAWVFFGKFTFKTKAYNAPLYERAMQIKRKALC